jgi:hypothetical protein
VVFLITVVEWCHIVPTASRKFMRKPPKAFFPIVTAPGLLAWIGQYDFLDTEHADIRTWHRFAVQ